MDRNRRAGRWSSIAGRLTRGTGSSGSPRPDLTRLELARVVGESRREPNAHEGERRVAAEPWRDVVGDVRPEADQQQLQGDRAERRTREDRMNGPADRAR